ncbi:sensor histidine kinase [Chitinibacter sp. S2-10]|uniref:sensor histidine kinase n=1 Tax=Chitinibacter sp. S2-10 TaxID=3373597 RepID=UPI003977AE70
MNLKHRSISDNHWRSLALFNVFRLLIIIGLMVGMLTLSRNPLLDSANLQLVPPTLGVYTLFALFFTWAIRQRKPSFDLQLSFQVMVDVMMIVLLMHLGGGIKSGLGILLLPYLAAAGLIARGRMTLFHASMATIALLLELVWQYLSGDAADVNSTSSALLSVASFAVAWLAFRLSRYAEENRVLAEQRSVDLANLAQVNARILQDVSDGVFVVDEQNIIRQYNEQAARLTGLKPAIGSSLYADVPELATPLIRWRSQPGVATELVQTAGGRNTLRARFVPLSSDGNGNVLIYLEDMARLRREAQQLKLAALGRLTANLAHEIRNPLGAISQAAELLREEVPENAVLQKLTRIINDNSLRLERMVKEVLELNRRDRVTRQEIRLADWLMTFNEQFTLQEKIQQPIQIECDRKVLVHFDSGHLQQVLWNLARNGWRYCSQRAGSLQIIVTRQHDFWVLDVLNDGPSVPTDALSQLFEPFFTTDSKGTGLGLYIAREICAANGALLEYLAPPRGGACFRIVFEYSDGQKI